ncbi:hemolytic protein HlpA-like protein [Synechococcus sp. BDU 130192]|uniref:hemolytic protein HlpA-like protein n=1 Tax=Synechococcus sp. BDU 130192 TaxID=2042059 RepID=UPI000C08837A|nr:hemolytic protein HlpA-like protein [Synechococcus sp. BDU 130192]
MLKTPVVFIIFNRPDLTQIVFNEIRKAQPKQLFVIADGPRTPEEQEKCQAARDVIKQVDWDCEVFCNYSDMNLGCRERVSSGITWVFEQVEEAIILEDDCVPAPSFFSFCETLLDYYRHDERIMVINGSNFQNGIQRTSYSYYFSRYNDPWGWATWKRAWNYWSFDKDKWTQFKQENLLEQISSELIEIQHWRRIFDNLFFDGEPNSWFYVWMFSCWSQGGLSISPNQNLIKNIGFRKDATHTLSLHSSLANLPTQNIWNIEHPLFIVEHKEADFYTFDFRHHGKELKQKQHYWGRLIWLFNRLLFFLKSPQHLKVKIKELKK